MFDYDGERLRHAVLEVTRSNIASDAWTWLEKNLISDDTPTINTTFSLISRKTGRAIITIKPDLGALIREIKPGFSMEGWSADRLCRVCFLMHLDASDKDRYLSTIERLFLAAEMSELVALYSSLPILAYPEMWKDRCAEGIRSNIATVLEAIMYHNPYPAEHLSDEAWNQLVMKAFFTDKDVNLIYGFDRRANRELTQILSDYAHERWAAGRTVNPLLWRATSKFVDENILQDLKKVLNEGTGIEKRAAALTLIAADYENAKAVLSEYPDLIAEIEQSDVKWVSLRPNI